MHHNHGDEANAFLAMMLWESKEAQEEEMEIDASSRSGVRDVQVELKPLAAPPSNLQTRH